MNKLQLNYATELMPKCNINASNNFLSYELLFENHRDSIVEY